MAINTLKKLAAGAAALTATVGATVLVPGTAEASLNKCNVGAFCVWYYDNYDGKDGDENPDWERFGNSNWSGYIVNDDESWFNNADWNTGGGIDHVRVYDANGTDSLTLCVEPGGAGDMDAKPAAANRGNYHRWSANCSGVSSSKIIRD